MNLAKLKVGDRVQYTGAEVGGVRWIWRGHVAKVTRKFFYVQWTHFNSPVFGGEVKESNSHSGRFCRNASDHPRNLETHITRIL